MVSAAEARATARSEPISAERAGSSALLRAERRERGGSDQAGRVPGGGVLGGGVHEAVRGGDQPLPRHVAAEGPGLLALLDQGLDAAQDPVMDAADALGGEFA